ncbi:MAG TPA: hypothetical protein PLN56_04770 [Methanoregulaceae archaeon]|nr:MAG: hypothetical protein IPI71_06485 [Methanolinea sp.]HON81490.1 hypothetical protein [Methanoregulaceae archaeon]HPD10296.1 hypothetical protein [Methanoregulaceae archaeon]HRT15474.1 hypothetical protein [Methanoregulaceae archaeon]HRU30947.1 hypothetical protein [Methanoregulaceae archaeon]
MDNFVRTFSWQLKLGIVLVCISALIYAIKLTVLQNTRDTMNYIFNSLGFLPISVFLVTIVLNELLAIRARNQRLEKINMVIETFYSEVGTELLTYLSGCDPNLDEVRHRLVITGDWTAGDFSSLNSYMAGYSFGIDLKEVDLFGVSGFLKERRNFLLRLLENPVLLEHQSFTETLRAVFHLTEELNRRKDLSSLPDSDLDHLKGDLLRVYRNLALQWVDYVHYLKRNFPYLFSLAMRTNPFDQNASVIVTR